MDNITHSMMGAGIAGALLTRRVGAKAMLVGLAVANMPDVDVFFPHADIINAMTYHRGFTHSLLFETAVAPFIAWGVTRAWARTREHWWPLLLTVWLCLTTHALLDSLTTYGTQLFWPIHAIPPVAFPSIFIIDPLFTLILMTGFLIMLFRRRKAGQGLTANRVTLSIAALYLAAGITAHLLVAHKAKDDPAFADAQILVQPTPVNLLFWQVTGVTDDQYIQGYSFPLPSCPFSGVTREPRMAAPPAGFDLQPSVQRLEWFTNGFYTYSSRSDALAISDLRIGVERALPFTFIIGRAGGTDGAYEPVTPRQAGGLPASPNALGNIITTARENWALCGG